MWRTVELREIETFLVLAEELHFGRTGERLGVSASRVSQILRTLEVKLGSVLFERTSRRVALTAQGSSLRRPLEEAYGRLTEVVRSAADPGGGRVRLGMATLSAGGPRLLEIIRAVEARQPRIEVEIVETGFVPGYLEPLRRGQVDAMAVRLPIAAGDLVIGPELACEERVVAVASTHPLARRSEVHFDELAGLEVPDVATLPPELRDDICPARTPGGGRIHRRPVRTAGEALAGVARGELVHPTVGSFLAHHRHPGVTSVRLAGLPPSRAALVWRRGAETPAIRALAESAWERTPATTPPEASGGGR